MTALLYAFLGLFGVALIFICDRSVRRILSDVSETSDYKKTAKTLKVFSSVASSALAISLIVCLSHQYSQYKRLDETTGEEIKAQNNSINEAEKKGIMVSYVRDGFALTENRGDGTVIVGIESLEKGKTVISYHKVPAHINSVYNLVTEKDDQAIMSESDFIKANKTDSIVLIKDGSFKIAVNKSKLPMIVETTEMKMENAGKALYYENGPVDRLILSGDTYYR